MSLKSKIESLLLVSNQPMSAKKLAELIKSKVPETKKAIDELMKDYKERQDCGIKMLKVGDKVQLASNPDNAKLVQGYIKDETTGELTRPQLETLTIIAYRGPIAKTELEMIRGVNCSLILRNLLIRGLIEEQKSKSKMENRYQISMEFLKFLGLNQTSELPDYEKLNSSEKLLQILDR